MCAGASPDPDRAAMGSSTSLEELDGSLVPLRLFTCLERSEIASSAGFRLSFP